MESTEENKLAAEVTNAELMEIVKKQGEKINQLSKMVSAKKETDITLNKKEELPTIPEDEVEVNGKKYQFTVAHFRLPNRSNVILASEAALDGELLKEIVAIKGQNILKELV